MNYCGAAETGAIDNHAALGAASACVGDRESNYQHQGDRHGRVQIVMLGTASVETREPAFPPIFFDGISFQLFQPFW